MKISGQSGTKFEIGAVTGYASTENSGLSSCDACYLEVHGRRPLNRSERSDRIYFVHDGSGQFIVDDLMVSVLPGDFVVVQKNQVFEYSGQMTLIGFTTPPFNGTGEVELEPQ